MQNGQSIPDISALMDAGAALHRAGRLDEALAQFERARDLQSTNVDPLSACASVLADMGLPRAAWQAALKGRNALWATADGAANFGVIAETAGEWKEAENAYEHALELAPDNVRALNNLALLRARASSWDSAVLLAMRCVELAPHEPLFALTCCDVLVAAHRVDEALVQLDAALARFLGNTSFMLRKAIALATVGRMTEARAALSPLGMHASTRLRDYLRHSRPAALRPAPFDLESIFFKRCAHALRDGDDTCLSALAAYVARLNADVGVGKSVPVRDWQDLLCLAPAVQWDSALQTRLQSVTTTVLLAQARTLPPVPAAGWTPADTRIRLGIAVPAIDTVSTLNQLADQIAAMGGSRFAFHVYGPALPREASAENTAAIARLRSVADVVELLFLTPADMAMRLRMDRLQLLVDFTHGTPWSIELLMHARMAPMQLTTDMARVAPLAPYDASVPDLKAVAGYA